MIGHQHPGPDFHIGSAAGRRQEIAVQRITSIVEKGLRPPVATLRDVMRQTGKDETSETAHPEIIGHRSGCVN